MKPEQLKQAIEALKNLEQRISAGMEADDQTQVLLQDTLMMLTQERLIDAVDEQEETGDFDTRFNQVLGAFDRAGEDLEDQADRLRMHLDLGDTLYRLGRRKEAQSHYDAAKNVAEMSEDQGGLAEALRRIGRLKRRQGSWHQARRALRKAARIYHDIGNTAGEAETCLNLGNIDFEQGEYEQAEKQFHKALDLCGTQDTETMTANINLSLGAVHQVRGQAEQAIAHFTASLDTFEAMGDDLHAAHTHFNIGNSYRDSGALSRSGMSYEKSLALARKQRDLGQIGMIYLRRAETQILISDASIAVSYSRRAMRLFIRVEDPLGQADAYRVYGQAATIRKAWGQARDYLTESLNLQQKYKSPLGEAETLETWGQFYEMQNDGKEAMGYYEKALALFHSLQAINDENRVKDMIGQLKLSMVF